MTQALCGCEVSVVTLDGRTLNVKVREIVRPGFFKVVSGEGMPDQKTPNTRGNLIINFNIQFPTYLSEEQKRQISAILGP